MLFSITQVIIGVNPCGPLRELEMKSFYDCPRCCLLSISGVLGDSLYSFNYMHIYDTRP